MNFPLIQSLLNRLQDWFSQLRKKATDAEEVICDLPEATHNALEQRLSQLPTPTTYQKAVRTSCFEAISAWRKSLQAENSLVIMAEPVAPISRILIEALSEASLDDDVDICFPLADYQRPNDALAIPSFLLNALEPREDEPATSENSPSIEESDLEERLAIRKQVMVIPALEQCFLRCIGGWEGIEDLQKRIVQDRSRFWVIGCSSWAWAFLDRVCHISAYLENIIPLPKLSKEELRDWLEPLVNQAVLAGNSGGDSDTKKSGNRDSYWSALANLSEGISIIAAQLWLRSLGIRDQDLPDDDQASLAPEDLPLCLRKPVLPSLPGSIQDNRYLLHSLLIHGCLTRPQLTISLGESESEERSRVQVLQREGVVTYQQNQLTINPYHFPRLRSELSSNNFLIGKALL